MFRRSYVEDESTQLLDKAITGDLAPVATLSDIDLINNRVFIEIKHCLMRASLHHSKKRMDAVKLDIIGAYNAAFVVGLNALVYEVETDSFMFADLVELKKTIIKMQNGIATFTQEVNSSPSPIFNMIKLFITQSINIFIDRHKGKFGLEVDQRTDSYYRQILHYALTQAFIYSCIIYMERTTNQVLCNYEVEEKEKAGEIAGLQEMQKWCAKTKQQWYVKLHSALQYEEFKYEYFSVIAQNIHHKVKKTYEINVSGMIKLAIKQGVEHDDLTDKQGVEHDDLTDRDLNVKELRILFEYIIQGKTLRNKKNIIAKSTQEDKKLLAMVEHWQGAIISAKREIFHNALVGEKIPTTFNLRLNFFSPGVYLKIEKMLKVELCFYIIFTLLNKDCSSVAEIDAEDKALLIAIKKYIHEMMVATTKIEKIRSYFYAVLISFKEYAKDILFLLPNFSRAMSENIKELYGIYLRGNVDMMASGGVVVAVTIFLQIMVTFFLSPILIVGKSISLLWMIPADFISYSSKNKINTPKFFIFFLNTISGVWILNWFFGYKSILFSFLHVMSAGLLAYFFVATSFGAACIIRWAILGPVQKIKNLLLIKMSAKEKIVISAEYLPRFKEKLSGSAEVKLTFKNKKMMLEFCGKIYELLDIDTVISSTDSVKESIIMRIQEQIRQNIENNKFDVKINEFILGEILRINLITDTGEYAFIVGKDPSILTTSSVSSIIQVKENITENTSILFKQSEFSEIFGVKYPDPAKRQELKRALKDEIATIMIAKNMYIISGDLYIALRAIDSKYKLNLFNTKDFLIAPMRSNIDGSFQGQELVTAPVSAPAVPAAIVPVFSLSREGRVADSDVEHDQVVVSIDGSRRGYEVLA